MVCSGLLARHVRAHPHVCLWRVYGWAGGHVCRPPSPGRLARPRHQHQYNAKQMPKMAARYRVCFNYPS